MFNIFKPLTDLINPDLNEVAEFGEKLKSEIIYQVKRLPKIKHTYATCAYTVKEVLKHFNFETAFWSGSIERCIINLENLSLSTQDAVESLGNNGERAQVIANRSTGFYFVLAAIAEYADKEKKKGGQHHICFVVPGRMKSKNNPCCWGGGFDKTGIENLWYQSDANTHFAGNLDKVRYFFYGVRK